MSDSCRDSWHVFDFLGNVDTLTCRCGERTLPIAQAPLTRKEEPAHADVAL